MKNWIHFGILFFAILSSIGVWVSKDDEQSWQTNRLHSYRLYRQYFGQFILQYINPPTPPMTRKEELELIIQQVRKEISSHAKLVPQASQPDSDFYMPELKKSLADLEMYITEYKALK